MGITVWLSEQNGENGAAEREMDFAKKVCYNKLMFGKLKRVGTKNLKRGRNAGLDEYGEMQPNEQLQNRVVWYFANGEKAERMPEGVVEVTPEQKQKVIKDLHAGAITRKQIERFLLQVLSPLQDLKTNLSGMYQQIVKDKRQKQILAVATGHDMRNWQSVDEEDLENLLSKPAQGQLDYRTPVGFATFRAKFLNGIKDQATPEQMQEYIRAMDGVELGLYGRRFEYYQQILLMGGATAKRTETNKADDELLEAVFAEEATNKKTPEEQKVTPVAANVHSVQVSGAVTVSPERSREILSKAVIKGDVWVQDGAEYHLEVANLMSGGLVPIYEIAVEGETILLSEPFQLSDGRGAMLGYVVTETGAKVRGYYLDMKTGLWHFAPDIIRGARGEGLGQIGEAYGLASTMLPIVLQNTMSGIVKAGGFREITAVNPDFLFAGTAMAYNTPQEYRDSLLQGRMRGDFYKEVDRSPVNEGWQPNGKTKNVPQLISVNTDMAPNFQNNIVRFATYSMLAGQVAVNGFMANDGQLVWSFCNDDWGRAWLGNVEVVSPMTSTGCRRDWMTAGDLATPLYEYSTQAGNYGDPNDTRKGLVGMWNQYLSKIPLLQEYVQWRGGQR